MPAVLYACRHCWNLPLLTLTSLRRKVRVDALLGCLCFTHLVSLPEIIIDVNTFFSKTGKYVMPDGALRDPPPDMVHLGPTLPQRLRTVSPCNHMRHSPGYPHALPYTYSSHYEYIWQPHSQY